MTKTLDMNTSNEIEIKNTDSIYTLSIASKLSEIPAHSIRQYIDKGLIIPFTTKSKRHLFSQIDVLRLKCIRKNLNEDGLNIAGIKALYSIIPCWEIKPCSKEDRKDCGAYQDHSQPCWDASNKSEVCLNSDCRECAVYKIPEGCQDVKSLIKRYI